MVIVTHTIRLRRWYLTAAIGLASAVGLGNLAAWLPTMLRSIRAGSIDGVTGGTDFAMFRAAAHLAAQGRWTEVYSLGGLADMMSATFGGVSFAYPPPFAIALRPLVGVIYPTALAIWLALGVASLCLMLWVGGRPALIGLLAMLFPAYVALRFGQFIPVAILALGLAGWSLKRNKLFLAGVFLGLLVLKPQLLVGPVILLMTSRELRRSILAGALTSSVVVVALSAVFALEAWTAFIEGFSDVAAPGVATRWDFSIINVTGQLPRPLGLLAASVVALGLIWLAARVASVSADAAELIALGLVLSLLISPRLVVYDWALLMVPFAWIGRNVRTDSPLIVLGGSVALASLSGYLSVSWLAWAALAASLVGAAYANGSHLSIRNPVPT